MAKLEPIQLDVETTSNNKGIDEAEKRILGFSKSATDASKKILVGFAAIGTAGIAAAGFGIKMAGDLEAARQGFLALLGSAEAADSTMSRIKKEAASTPFELPGLVAGTQALAAITKDGDKAIDMLLDVGKAVAVSGKGQASLDSVVLNLQQISSTGKVTAMDIKQFQGAIPIFNDIVEAAGMTVDQIQNADNAAELLGLAFKAAGEEGGIAAEGFTSQAGTWNQLFSNFKDNIGIIASEFVVTTGIFELAKTVLGKIVDFMGNLITPDSIAKFKEFTVFLQENQPLLAIFGATLFALVAPALWVTATAAWAALVPILLFAAPIIAVGVAAAALYLAFTNNFMGIRDIADSVVNFVTGTIFPILEKGFKIIQVALTVLYNVFNFIFQLIKALVIIAVDYIANTALGKTLIAGFEFVSKHIGQFQESWGLFWDGVGYTVKGAVDGIVKWVREMVDKVKGFVNNIIGSANDVGKAIPGWKEIPMFAKGVTNFSGGPAVVGENGPEIVNLPRGSDVIPNNKIQSALGGGQSSRPISITQYIQDSIDLDFALREIAYEMRTA